MSRIVQVGVVLAGATIVGAAFVARVGVDWALRARSLLQDFNEAWDAIPHAGR